MPEIEFFNFRDFFQFFRFWLGLIVTIYFSIVTIQSAWGWYLWLSGADRYTSMLRRYLVVQGLRLRFRAFWGDVIICALLCVAFFLLWHAQTIMDQTVSTLEKAQKIIHVQRPERHS